MDEPPFKKRWLMERDDDIESMEVDSPDSDRQPMEVDPPPEDILMEVYLPSSGHTSHHPITVRLARKRSCPRHHCRGTRIRPPPSKRLPQCWH